MVSEKMSKARRIDSFFKRKNEDYASPSVEAPSVVDIPLSSAQDPTASLIQAQNQKRKEVIFLGIESLERDPGLRPQIMEYPVSQRDEVRRAYLHWGPMQPDLENYKASGPQGHQRRFKAKWFDQFRSWLEYSESNGRAYCFCCFLFSNNLNKRVGSDAFTVRGFENWKKVNDGKNCAFLSHVGSDPCSQHNNAHRACEALLHQSGHVDNIIHVQSQQEKEKNRMRLKVSIAAVKWLTLQGCAFRGHDETPDSSNRGNFLELIRLIAEFNPEIEKVVLDNAPFNSKYTSPDIQKEILSIYASLVRKHIRNEIGESKFCIIVDETCDIAKREQMALILRFVDQDGVLQERFFDLVHVKTTTSLTLKEKLSSVLSNHSLDVQNIRGQGYDGSSNMRGELNGLQALFLKECPYAYYVHCYAHRLQLALVGASKLVIPVGQFFHKLGFIINTVDSSAKRRDELRDAQASELSQLLALGELETGRGANQIGSLKRAGDTRWGSHLGSICSLIQMFNAVRSVLEHIGDDASSGSLRGDADAAYGYINSFEFVFILCLMREILEISDILNQALQRKSQDIVNAVRLIASTNQFLQNLRDDGWECFFDKVTQFCETHDVFIPDMNDIYILRDGRARRQPNNFTNDHYFRVEIYLVTIDTQLQELSCRFNEKVIDLLSLMGTIVPKNNFSRFDSGQICRAVEKYYPDDFSAQDRIGLEYQLRHFVYDISVDDEMKKIDTLTELCHRLVQSKRHIVYPLVDRLLRLLVTLPVSTASAERAFSVLSIIKTKLRNRMEDGFLANSLLVNIEGGIVEKFEYEDIIEDFRNLKKRRAPL